MLLPLPPENFSLKVIVVLAHYLTTSSGSLVWNFRGLWYPVASVPLFNINIVTDNAGKRHLRPSPGG